jgi:hypothetical protein
MKTVTSLPARLRKVGRRLWMIGACAAVAAGLAAALVLLVLGAWLDLLWEIPPEWRIAAWWIAAAGAAALLALVLGRTAARGRPAALARRLDFVTGSGGAVLTGLDLYHGLLQRTEWLARPTSAGLAAMAVEHAAAVAGRAPPARTVPLRPATRATAVFGLLALGLCLWGLAMPGLFQTEWLRFTQPWADVPPYSPLRFTVTPGDIEVLYGGELEIGATVEGGIADRLELVLLDDRGEQTSLPMFSEPGGKWRAVLSKLTDPTVYFVQAYRARSEKYRIAILSVPQLESVRVRIVPPEYSGQPPFEGPVPEGGVKGLRGTRTTVWATSNRPLSGGTLLVQRKGAKVAIPMRPSEPGGQEATGQFLIEGDGKFECRVIDEAGQPSQQAFSANVTMVADQHPLVRILEPPPLSLATPTAPLPVLLSAEDDCGLSRLELYRNLNESRPLPAQVKLPRKWPHRCEERVVLPLAGYGLSPGDTIKLFARAEDNDPAGAKGAESQVVVVRIISQEEFERMVQLEQGLETLAAKYHEAMRRLESLDKEAGELRKKLAGLPPGPLSDQVRKDLEHLQQAMREASDAMSAAAAHPLPFDLDRALTPELEKLVGMTDEMAKELEKLDKQLDLLPQDLAKKLDEMAKRLAEARGQYGNAVMKPMEHLEAIFPLLVDQERFVVLVLRQQDLAERMASLRGHDDEDNPALRARMRDLEYEQRQIRLALDDLLDDIQDHATRLPDVRELDKLRATAVRFAREVRASGAAPAMRAAENALAEFAGTRGHGNAKEAADILEQFLKRCQGAGGMEAECLGALVFQPMLCNGLGDTVAQLLAAMGLGSGSGYGGAGGYGNYGLYGQMPGLGGVGRGAWGHRQNGLAGHGPWQGGGAAGGENPDASSPSDAPAAGAATAGSDALVPVRYRRQVGQYFERLSKELGDRPRPERRGEK